MTTVLPLYFKMGLGEIELPLLSHGADYCHLQSGGGVNPYIVPAGHLPVRFKEGLDLPAPLLTKPYSFQWRRHGPGYDYFIVSGAPLGEFRQVQDELELVARSGPWRLYRNPLRDGGGE